MKLTNKDFTPFCSTRETFAEPFRQDGRVIATTGAIAVSVPESEFKGLAPEMLRPSTAHVWDDFPTGRKVALPKSTGSIKEAVEDCTDCDGSGSWSHDDCGHCKGHKCRYCEGSGKRTLRRAKVATVGGRLINSAALEMIRRLPNPRIIRDGKEATDALYFTFGKGGIGAVMPMQNVKAREAVLVSGMKSKTECRAK